MQFISCPVKYDENRKIIYDSTLRRILFDLVNENNFEDEVFSPQYGCDKKPDYAKIWKAKNKR